MHDQLEYDVLIIGSGAAGLSLALKLADHSKVAVLSKNALIEGATLYAQGGVSAVLDKHDSIESHVEDTLATGAGLCDPKIVQFVVKHAQESINWLVDIGVDFTRSNDSSKISSAFHLNKEGGHSHRRVIHAADATGKAIETTLETKVRHHKNIELFEHHIAVDLIVNNKFLNDKSRCTGAYVLDDSKKTVKVFRARNIVLATGGAGKVYLYTSNPDSCTGDGIAMASRIGCRVVNMEFVQFHPTCLYHPMTKSFLISEALRGEGAKLILNNGNSFMERYDNRKELAPRDIVARAIDYEMKRLGDDCVYLDISHKSEKFIAQHFPNIFQRCLDLGINIAADPIPVVPAAHYTCGGILVNKNGQTDIPGLYAIGEVSYTGLHGANRMASNSLLECFVFAHSAFNHIKQTLSDIKMPEKISEWDESRVTNSDEEVVVSHNWDEIRRFMWDYVGIVRTTKRLDRANHRIKLLQSEISEYYSNFRITKDLVELRNLASVSELIIESALKRKESRGLHYTTDFPAIDNINFLKNTTIKTKNSAKNNAAA